MEYVRLGATNLRVSKVALGAMGFGSPSWRSWVLDPKPAGVVIRRAIELGINFIDTCDFYSKGESERIVGSVLSDMRPKPDVIVATKLGSPMSDGINDRGYSRKHIIEGVDACLMRLKTDRIDLLQTHIWDSSTNLEEMVEAFDYVVRQGKVLYLGATDIPCWQLSRAVYHAKLNGLARFSTLQHHYNALWREDERDLIPYCNAEGIGLLPYSPIARGLLAGAERRLKNTTERSRTDQYASLWYGRPEDTKLAEIIENIASRLSLSAATVALSWVRTRLPNSVPIFGATNVSHVEEAVKSTSIVLPEEDFKAIEEAYRPRSHGGHF